MTVHPEKMRTAAREMLLADECAMSHFGYADHFRELEHLHRTIEDLISREEKTELETLAKHAENLPEHVRGEFWADNHPYWWGYIIVPQFRGAFFISLMSAVELHLGRLANDAAVIVDAPIGYDELRGGVYQRIKRFLHSFARVEVPDERWRRIADYYVVRNTLAHSGGLVRESDLRTIERLAATVGGIRVATGHLELEREFCEAALRECHEFLRDVWAEMVQLCRSYRSEGVVYGRRSNLSGEADTQIG
jgi:hypothetical protein